MAVAPALREFTEDYLEKSFKSKIHKLAQCYFQDMRGGNLGSNAISKQENSSFKRDPHGPRPHLGIDCAVIATTAHETRRLDGLRRNGMQSLSQTQQEHETEEDTNDQLAPCNLELDLLKLLVKQKDRQCDKVELSKYLVDLAVTTLSQQYEASTVHTKMQTNHLLDVLVCTCGHFIRTGAPCRHIYCVLQRPPRATYCNIRHLKIYESYFGRDQQVTSILLEQFLTPLEGPLIGHNSPLDPNPSENFDLNWFKEAMDTIVLRPGVQTRYLSGMQGSIRTVTNCYDSPVRR
jgi:SWIM zinc finger